MLVLLNLIRSRVGRALRAIHGAEDAARAMGVDAARYKLRTFILSALLAATGGVFLAHYNGGIGPSEATVLKSIRYLAVVAVGGMGSLWGALTMSAVLSVAARLLRHVRRRRVRPHPHRGHALLPGRAPAPRPAAGAAERAPAAASAAPGGAAVSALLEVSGVAKRFGGVQAVKDVSFQVAPGAIKAVIGPNGAGKTTLFNLVSGFLAPDAGEIRFKGERVGGRRPHEIAARGISRTFQHIRLFAGMTAIENVMVGVHVRSRAGFLAGMLHLPWTWREERDIRRRALDAMRLLDIEALAGADATSLSYGQQRSVELARALAAEPELLLLDEPAAGLNMRETAELAALVCRIRDRGVTVLIVEHDVSLVMSVSDEIVVLSYGEKIADADPETVQRDPGVVRVYLGEDEDAQGS